LRTIPPPKIDIGEPEERNVAPTVNNDATEGFFIGSRWVDIVTKKEFVCVDATEGAANWKETTTSGSDELAKVSANDTTAGFLNGKLVAGANITLNEIGDGGNETLSIVASSAAHALGGASHTADTLANLNSKVSDATLIDTGDSRLSDNRTDADAIHDNVGSEISAIVEKVTPVGADVIIIEDSAATFAKKKVQITNLPAGAPVAHALGGAQHIADTLANLNTKVSDATLIDTGDARLSDTRDPNAHALGGSAHSADTLANLNSKVSDATLIDTTDSRLSDARTPTTHALGGTEHSVSTLAQLNAKVSDATLDDSSATRTPSAHALGGAAHSADTLANLNSKVSDATLIDTTDSRLSDARTPTAHNLGGSEHNADTLANLNSKVSDATLKEIKHLQSWTANDAIFPATTPAAAASRNGHALIAFDDSVDEVIILESVLPEHYDGGPVQVLLHWIAATAIINDVKWNAEFERMNTDLDADSFAAAQTTTDTTNGTSGIITVTTITFTQAQADAIVAGDAIRIRLTRDADAVGDTVVGDAQLLRIVLEEQ